MFRRRSLQQSVLRQQSWSGALSEMGSKLEGEIFDGHCESVIEMVGLLSIFSTRNCDAERKFPSNQKYQILIEDASRPTSPA